MYKRALEVLKIFEDNGYSAYIVGGYVRDFCLNIESCDIDICTSARPYEIIKLFDTVFTSDINYGSVKIVYKKYKYDITTFRKEIKYENNRKPVKIKYINDLKKDLLRRDFTVNTLCMDSSGNIIDLLGAMEDLDNKVIKTVGSPRYKIKEDSLRILRSIRFASNLGFRIDDKTKHYLRKYGYLLRKLSVNRKRSELDKLFASVNKNVGRDLLISLKLDKYLDLNNLSSIVMCDNIIGIWSQLNVDDIYPFTKLEREQMKKIRLMLEEGVNRYTIYKYGLYISTIVGDILDFDLKDINKIYHSLAIYSRTDIKIKPLDIANILSKEPGSYIKDIISDLEENIVNNRLNNDYDDIKNYIKEKYL